MDTFSSKPPRLAELYMKLKAQHKIDTAVGLLREVMQMDEYRDLLPVSSSELLQRHVHPLEHISHDLYLELKDRIQIYEDDPPPAAEED